MLAAMDVGGTNIRCHIIDDTGEIVGSEFMETQTIGLVEAIELILDKYQIDKIGISYAGQISKGVILTSPNIKVDEPNIQAYFLEKHHIGLFIENDLKCAALAEYEYRDCSSTMVAASVGTGFGSAIVEKGKLLRGSINLAGEIGHSPYRYSEIPCGCGNHYCIEASCSGSALTCWAEYYGLPVQKQLLQSLRDMDKQEANEIVERFHEGLLFAVGSLISLINPELIVLGGGVIHKNKYLLDIINENIDKYALPTARRQTKIIISELEDASLKGAGLLAEYHSRS